MEVKSTAELQETLTLFFNQHHDKLLCTANHKGEPNIALMGTPKLLENGKIQFEISEDMSLTLENILENKAVTFMAYQPGQRARDYSGVRIYALVSDIRVEGEALEEIRKNILAKYGAGKAKTLKASILCDVTRIRPVIDRGQLWNEPPLEEDE